MSKIDDMILELFKKNKIKFKDGPSKKLASLTYGKAIFKNPRPVFDLIRATEQAIEFYIDTDNALAYKPKFQDDSYPKRADPWGKIQGEAVQTLHTAGTTITYSFTCPTGFEIKLLETYTLASRAPDVSHNHRIYRNDAGGTGRLTASLFEGTTSTTGYWPSSDEVATLGVKNTVEGMYMKPGDELRFLITNNSQAGDTLDTIITYQQREV